MPNYYPIMLDLRNRAALVIGGDHVAAEKAAALNASGARVTVMSSAFCDELLDLEQSQAVALRYKTYEPGDLAGAFVVVAAVTNDPLLAEVIWQEAQERGQLVNIVDMPARCNFILPSILRRGKLTVAVSTEGSSPSMAKRTRQYLEDLLPPEYDAYLRLAAAARACMKESGLSYAGRDAFFGAFFASDVLQLLIEEDETEALASTVRLLRRYHVDISVSTIINAMQEAERGDNRVGAELASAPEETHDANQHTTTN